MGTDGRREALGRSRETGRNGRKGRGGRLWCPRRDGDRRPMEEAGLCLRVLKSLKTVH